MSLSVTVCAIASAIFLYSFTRGGSPEKLAGLFIVGWVFSGRLVQSEISQATFQNVELLDFLWDAALFAATTVLAVRANRVWPCVVAGSSLVMLCGHASASIYPHGMKQAYWAMSNLPFLIAQAALVSGISAHRRRSDQLGRYCDWRIEKSVRNPHDA